MTRSQRLPVMVETVPMRPRLRAHPPIKLVGGDVPQFQHSACTPRRWAKLTPALDEPRFAFVAGTLTHQTLVSLSTGRFAL